MNPAEFDNDAAVQGYVLIRSLVESRAYPILSIGITANHVMKLSCTKSVVPFFARKDVRAVLMNCIEELCNQGLPPDDRKPKRDGIDIALEEWEG